MRANQAVSAATEIKIQSREEAAAAERSVQQGWEVEIRKGLYRKAISSTAMPSSQGHTILIITEDEGFGRHVDGNVVVRWGWE